MSDDIEATGHRLWIPIPLDLEPDALLGALVERFGPDADTAASAMVGVGRQLREANVATADDGLINLAAWALVSEPDVLQIRGFATFRAVGVDSGVTEQDCIDAVIGDTPLFQPALVETMETMSGDATSLRYRPMGDDSEVHQVLAVLWPRPASNALYVLSSYSTDLVEAAEIGDRLDELGAGMKGL